MTAQKGCPTTRLRCYAGFRKALRHCRPFLPMPAVTAAAMAPAAVAAAAAEGVGRSAATNERVG